MLLEKAGTTRPILGGFIKSSSPWLVEVLGVLGFDLVIIDTEHGMIGLRDCEELVRAADATQILSLIRVASADPINILRLAETGPDGIVVPRVRTAEDVKESSDAVRYPPEGARGLGRSRAANFGAQGALGDYVKAINAKMTVTAIVEDAEGLAAVDEIAAAPGLDMLFTGSVDMSVSLGVPGQLGHPSVLDANKKIVEAGKKAGKLVGGLAATFEEVTSLLDEGDLDVICVPTESIVVEHLKQIRALVPSR
ncbi:MAG: siderophore biosynthesis protein SbnG [Actinobacteria bacterium]|nr:siderophore biosynthesis protein SbnG [Actinomycetota bacterium]